jgi:hypothetical protein
MEDKEIISDHAYHQWKQHDCTKALLMLLDDGLDVADKSILGHVQGNNEINVNELNRLKGGYYTAHEIKHAVLNKKQLEVMLVEMEEEDVEQDESYPN